MNEMPCPQYHPQIDPPRMPSYQTPRQNRPMQSSGYMGGYRDPREVNYILKPPSFRQSFYPPQSYDSFGQNLSNRHHMCNGRHSRDMYPPNNSNIIDPNDVFYQEYLQHLPGRPPTSRRSYLMDKLAQQYKLEAYNLSHHVPPPFQTQKPYTVAPVSASCPFPAPQPQVYRTGLFTKKNPGLKGGMTKNAFVTCVCGDRIQFSLNVANNKKDGKPRCEICFERLRKDFEELVESYVEQGFIPCKCRGNISVSNLAAEYWETEGLRCICDDPSKMVHTCGKPAQPQRRFAAKSLAADFARQREEEMKLREEDEAFEEESYSESEMSAAASEEYEEDDYESEERDDFEGEKKSATGKGKSATFSEGKDDFDKDGAQAASEAPSAESAASQTSDTSTSKRQKRSVTPLEDDDDARAGSKASSRAGGGGRSRSEDSEDNPCDTSSRRAGGRGAVSCRYGAGMEEGGRRYPSSRSSDSDGYPRGGRGGRYRSPSWDGQSGGFRGAERYGPPERDYRRARDREGQGRYGGAGAYPERSSREGSRFDPYEDRRGDYPGSGRESRGYGGPPYPRYYRDDSRGSDRSDRSSRERPYSDQSRGRYGGERRPRSRSSESDYYPRGYSRGRPGRDARDDPRYRGGYEPRSDGSSSRGSRRGPDYGYGSGQGRAMRPDDRDFEPRGRRPEPDRRARERERVYDDRRRRPVGAGAGFQRRGWEERPRQGAEEGELRSRRPAPGGAEGPKRAGAAAPGAAAERARPRARSAQESRERVGGDGGPRPASERRKRPEAAAESKAPRSRMLEGERTNEPPREKKVTEKTVTKKTTIERTTPEEKEKPVKKKRPAETPKKAGTVEKKDEQAKEETGKKQAAKKKAAPVVVKETVVKEEEKPRKEKVVEKKEKKKPKPEEKEKIIEKKTIIIKDEKKEPEKVVEKKVVKKEQKKEPEKVEEKKEVKKKPKEEPKKVVKTEKTKEEVKNEEKKDTKKVVEKHTVVKEKKVVEEGEKPKKQRYSRSDMGSHHVTY